MPADSETQINLQLGKDRFPVLAISGTEALSCPFRFVLGVIRHKSDYRKFTGTGIPQLHYRMSVESTVKELPGKAKQKHYRDNPQLFVKNMEALLESPNLAPGCQNARGAPTKEQIAPSSSRVRINSKCQIKIPGNHNLTKNGSLIRKKGNLEVGK